MLGAVAATTAASMAGAHLALSPQLRGPMLVVIGALLGSSFEADMLHDLARWLPSLASLPLYVLVIGGGTLWFLLHVARLETVTAFFASAPGGFGEMVILAEARGADTRIVALIHATRILLIVSTVPLAARLLGLDGGQPPPATVLAPPELALVFAAATAGWFIATRLGLPAPALLGGMLGSAAVFLLGAAHGTPPSWLIAVAQLVIGASIGARFSGYPLASLLRTMLLGVALTSFMLTLTAIFGVAVAAATGLPALLLLLALVPGGLPEMTLVAIALEVDPAFVATHHIIRIALVVAMATPVLALVRRLRKRAASKPPSR